MKGKNTAVAFAILSLAALGSVNSAAQNPDDRELLHARETVWRAWFAGDTNTLRQLVPPETVVMSGGEEQWKHQSEVLRTSAEFHAKGGKLLQLEFPRTEVQHFGNVAIVWSSYVLEIDVDGKRSPDSGRVTEIFVRRNGHWTNPGWHTDTGK
jgi:ketosteroid isomerase-like protein